MYHQFLHDNAISWCNIEYATGIKRGDVSPHKSYFQFFHHSSYVEIFILLQILINQSQQLFASGITVVLS